MSIEPAATLIVQASCPRIVARQGVANCGARAKRKEITAVRQHCAGAKASSACLCEINARCAELDCVMASAVKSQGAPESAGRLVYERFSKCLTNKQSATRRRHRVAPVTFVYKQHTR